MDAQPSSASRLPTVSRLLFTCLLVLAGCSIPFRRQPPPPGRTTLKSPVVELPAQTVGNFLLLEVKWDRYGPYRFLVDTGSAVTLVTPALAKRYPATSQPPPDAPRVRVLSADGSTTELPAAWLKRLELGDAYFEDVPVLLYDFAAFSSHLGVKIDGLLGFPLFRELLLTLDYPASRVILRSARTVPLLPGTAIAFDDARKTPVIHVGLGNRSLVSLIDSGSDAGFSLNPIGLDAKFAVPPRDGPMIGTVAGDRLEQIARLSDTFAIGGYTFPQPVVNLTDELSSIGGAVLKNFTVTFDQEHDRVTFFRDSREPIAMPPQRNPGISFTRTPAYWKVAGVVAGSPAAKAEVRVGDLVTRINNEPVSAWDLRRYEQLIANASELSLTFLNGNEESSKRVEIFELVP